MSRVILSLAAAALASDVHKQFEQLAFENGFAAESYTVVTDDGYVSQIYRIPGHVQEVGHMESKPAVLMMHGWLCDMKFWTANDADLAPPFILASQGYDVWLGNNRGSRYSRDHVTLDNTSAEYWDFQFDVMGTHDTPAFIDFILDKTGQEQLTYIGHSRGTSQVFLGASVMPDYYAEKVNLFVALAPVTSLSNVANPLIHKAANYWREV